MNTKNTNAKNNTAKRNAGSVPAWDEIEQADTGKAARIERWRGHAAKIVPTYRTPALDALANAANLSPVEYVIAYLSATRGMNGGGAEELYHRTMDVELEVRLCRIVLEEILHELQREDSFVAIPPVHPCTRLVRNWIV